MSSRYFLTRSAASASRFFRIRYPPLPRACFNDGFNTRAFSVKSNVEQKHANSTSSKKKRSFLERVLAVDSSGQNPLLKALGYYSAESRALGAGKSLYYQALERADAIAVVEFDEKLSFSTWFEMVSVHIYLTLRRLRAEKGSVYENNVKTAMQCLFDVFWSDVRSRMIKDHNMTLITSGKWVKECEQMFFGLAMAFDEGWEDSDVMRDAIRRNITSLGEDSVKIEHFRKYMMKEHTRLERTSIEQIWEGSSWDGRDTEFRSI
ncbi:Ubiquinol-cytochrome C chaperone [Gracilaria domingensis]|nr:Ubiquinol-cytochrome C chaperone [Gracilaria domingensis]